MADKKISQLPAATTPLAGTEVLPIVQSGTTDKVSVANLTAGRAISAASLTLTTSALPIASGGTNQTAFTSPASSIAGLVWFDGTSFQNDSTTSHVGYNPSTNVFYANTPTFSGDTTLSTGNLVVGTSGKGIDFSATASTGTSELFADYEEGTWTPVVIGSGSNPTISYTTQDGSYTKIGRQVIAKGQIVVNTASGGTGVAGISGLPFASANRGTVNIGTGANWGTAIAVAGYVNAGQSNCFLVYNTTTSYTVSNVASFGTGATLEFTIIYEA